MIEMVLFLGAFVIGCAAAWIIQAVVSVKKAPKRGNARARRKASREHLQNAWAAKAAAQAQSQRKKAAAKKRRP